MLDALAHDARYALRWLSRSPGFAIVAILSLGVGIGCNTAIFAVVDALLLRPLPVREPSRLVDLYTSGADGDTYSTNSLPDLLDYRQQKDVFADVAGYSPMFAGVSRGDRARLVLGEIVTGNYFSTLGVSARLGRTLLPEDDAPDATRTVVLSNRYWQREFGGESGAIGKTLRIRGQEFTVVGVLDDGFTGMVPMLAPEIWLPVRFAEEVEPAGINEIVPSPTGSTRLDRRGQRWLFVKARLTPGTIGRTGTGQSRRCRCATARRASPNEQGPAHHRPADGRHPASPRSGPHARVDRDRDDARGGAGAGDRLRERGRDAARARGRSSARDRHPPRRRRRPRPSRPSAPDRKRHPRRPRRRRRPGAGLVADAVAHLLRLADPDCAVARSPAGYARSRLHGWRRAPHRHPGRPGAGTARNSRQPGLGSEGRHGRRTGRRPALDRARRARRRPDRRDDRAARDGRACSSAVCSPQARPTSASRPTASRSCPPTPTCSATRRNAASRYWSEVARRIEAIPGVQRVALASRLAVLAQFQSFQHRGPWTPEVRRRDGHVNQQRDGLADVLRNTRDRRAPRTRVRRVGRPRRPPRRDRE